MPPPSRDRKHSRSCELDVLAGVTTQDFVDSLSTRGITSIKFNAAGQGCRLWTGCPIDLFWGCGILIHANQIVEAKDAMRVEYPQWEAVFSRGWYSATADQSIILSSVLDPWLGMTVPGVLLKHSFSSDFSWPARCRRIHP